MMDAQVAISPGGLEWTLQHIPHALHEGGCVFWVQKGLPSVGRCPGGGLPERVPSQVQTGHAQALEICTFSDLHIYGIPEAHLRTVG